MADESEVAELKEVQLPVLPNDSGYNSEVFTSPEFLRPRIG